GRELVWPEATALALLSLGDGREYVVWKLASLTLSWRRPHGHRSDDNASDIIDALRDVGVLVWPIGRPADLLCRRAGVLYLLDVDGITRNRKRDKKQLENFQLWRV